jgi:hypothetical protein
MDLSIAHVGEASLMNEFQLFVFIILPIGVGLLGGLAVWAARFVP